MAGGRWWLVMAFLVALALPAGAQETAPSEAAPTAKPRYPVTVRVQLDPAARAARLDHTRSGGTVAPTNPSATLRLGDQALTAYVLSAQRMFAPATAAGPDAELVVLSAEGSLRKETAGWIAGVDHVVALRTLSGEELGRWTVHGEELLAATGHGALPQAFSRAARFAAMHLERVFEQPPAVVRWLEARGAALGVARPEEPPPLFVSPPPFAQPGPPRGEVVVYGEGGPAWPGVVGGRGALVRVGASTRLWFAQAWASWHRSDGPARTMALGADLGATLRLALPIEARAGVGLVRLDTGLEMHGVPYRGSRTSPSFFLAGQYTLRGSERGGRIRLGIDGRWVVGGAVDVEQTGPANPFVSSVQSAQVAGLMLGFSVGYEWPLR